MVFTMIGRKRFSNPFRIELTSVKNMLIVAASFLLLVFWTFIDSSVFPQTFIFITDILVIANSFKLQTHNKNHQLIYYQTFDGAASELQKFCSEESHWSIRFFPSSRFHHIVLYFKKRISKHESFNAK